MIEKISKLLAKAEAASTEAEAEAYFEKAQALSTAYSISLTVARKRNTQQRETPISRRVVIGDKGKHSNKHLVNLFYKIGKSNDVAVDVAHNSTYVIAYGFSSDIKMTESIWSSVAVTMARLSDAYIKGGKWRGEKVYRAKRVANLRWGGTDEVWDYFPITAQAARASWCEGFISRIAERAAKSRKDAVAEAVAQDLPTESKTNTNTALVLKAKEDEVSEFYNRTTDARGAWSGGRRTNGRSTAAHEAGRAAASSVSIGSRGALSGEKRQIGA